nr:osteocalcin 2-like [Bactrocera oleae]
MADSYTDSSSSSNEIGSVTSSSSSSSFSADSAPSSKESSAQKGFDTTENGKDCKSSSLSLLQEKNSFTPSEDCSPEEVGVKSYEKREENDAVRLTNTADSTSPEINKCESMENKAPGELEEGELSYNKANTQSVDDKERESEGLDLPNGNSERDTTGYRSVENFVDVIGINFHKKI